MPVPAQGPPVTANADDQGTTDLGTQEYTRDALGPVDDQSALPTNGYTLEHKAPKMEMATTTKWEEDEKRKQYAREALKSHDTHTITSPQREPVLGSFLG